MSNAAPVQAILQWRILPVLHNWLCCAEPEKGCKLTILHQNPFLFTSISIQNSLSLIIWEKQEGSPLPVWAGAPLYFSPSLEMLHMTIDLASVDGLETELLTMICWICEKQEARPSLGCNQVLATALLFSLQSL